MLIDGYSATPDWGQLALLLGRVALALYLLASALTRFDKHSIGAPEVALRLLFAVMLLWKAGWVVLIGAAGAALLLAWHYLIRSAPDPQPQP